MFAPKTKQLNKSNKPIFVGRNFITATHIIMKVIAVGYHGAITLELGC